MARPVACADIGIFIVSQHGLLRHSLRSLVEDYCDHVSTHTTLDQLKLTIGDEVKPNSVLLLEPVSNVALSDQIADVAKHSPNWHLMLVMRAIGDLNMIDCVNAGARGCITHDTPPEMIVRLIDVVSAGHIVWPSSPALGGSLDRRASDRNSRTHQRRPADLEAKLVLLSKREKEVLGFIGHGLGNKRIAAAMSISDTTVRLHMGSIMRKLGAENRTQVAILALHAQSEHGGP